MSATLGQAVVVVQVDNSRLRHGLDSARRDTQQATRHMETSFNNAGNAMGAMGKKLLGLAATYVGLRGITGGIAALTNAANEASETQNKFEVAFRTSRHEAEKSLEAYAKMAGGLNVSALKEYAASFQLLFNAMAINRDQATGMSTDLSKLAYDLASLYNTSIEEAFTRLQSGIVGETEAVRRFGVDVSEAALKQELLRQGSNKSYESLSNAEKVMLRYNMIMRQTTDAQGDLARTQDSGANVLRRFTEQFERIKIELGQGFRKVIEMVGPKILQFISKIDFKKVSADIAMVFYRIYEKAKPAIAFLVNGFRYVVNAVKEAYPAIKNFFTLFAGESMRVIVAQFGALAYAIGGVIKAMNWLVKAWVSGMQKIADSAKTVLDAIPGTQNSPLYRYVTNMQKNLEKLQHYWDNSTLGEMPDWIKDIMNGFQEASPLADKLPDIAPDTAALKEEAEAIKDLIEKRKEDMKAEMERRQQAIGFISGRELWEKATITGERQRFAAEPAKKFYGNFGAHAFFGGQDVSNTDLVKALVKDKENKQLYEQSMVDYLAAILSTLRQQTSNQVEMGYGN